MSAIDRLFKVAARLERKYAGEIVDNFHQNDPPQGMKEDLSDRLDSFLRDNSNEYKPYIYDNSLRYYGDVDKSFRITINLMNKAEEINGKTPVPDLDSKEFNHVVKLTAHKLNDLFPEGTTTIGSRSTGFDARDSEEENPTESCSVYVDFIPENNKEL